MNETETIGTLPDLPNFLTVETGEQAPFEDGWYEAKFVPAFETTNKDGVPITFESGDVVSQNGDSRNIRLRSQFTRKSDGRTSNQGVQVNYRPDVDFSTARLAAIAEGKTRQLTKDEKRSQMAVASIKELSKIAGTSLPRNSNGSGGFDVTVLFGKQHYVRWGDTKQKDGSIRKGIADFAAEPPKKGTL